MINDKKKLGSGQKAQTSISVDFNQKEITEKILKIISDANLIKKISKDELDIEFIDYLKKFKKVIFELNKHEEIYCKQILSNPLKIIKYLIFRFKFRQAGEKKILLDYPPYLLIEPVSACNLRCPFCFQTDETFTVKGNMGVMKFDLFKKVVDEADELRVGAITLASRGEPTMNKKLDLMLEYLSKKENIFEIKLNTNATYLTEKLCHTILKTKINQVVISADHYIKEDYERLRLNAKFEEVLVNVDRLFKIRKDHYPNSITEIRISGVDNDKNLDRKKFKDFWIKRSDHVTASFPIDRWNTYKNEKNKDISDPCENLWDRMYVWYDGKVNPCDADYKSYLSFGNVNNDSIANVWKSNRIMDLRKQHIDNLRNKTVPCDRCGVTFK